jgi:hypothetical protein
LKFSFNQGPQIGIFDMRKILVGLLLSLKLAFTNICALAMEYKSLLELSHSVDSVERDNIFYTKAIDLVQQQIYLMAGIEESLSDANSIRSVRG